MRIQLKMLPLLCVYLMLISATSIKIAGTPGLHPQNNMAITLRNDDVMKVHGLNFFQRLLVKYVLKRSKRSDVRADSLASTSLWLGVSACGLLLLGLFIPYIILASVPVAIAAMITGGSALRNKTSLIGKARTGKALGLGALIAFGVILLAAAIILASYFGGG